MASDKAEKKIVIVGGGIMGCATAYHLTALGTPCTLVERTSIACAASGKAGGFLARGWCDGKASGPLARASFELHKVYGSQFDCDYRAVDTIEANVDENAKRKRSLSSAPKWVDQETVLNTHVIGNVKDTAQVHPAKLCKGFVDAAQKKGCDVILAEVTGIEFDANDDSVILGVHLMDGRTIPCDTLVLTMGPWTNTASHWFDYRLPLIGAERAHSIVVRPKQPITACALFLKYSNSEGVSHPEVYPRPDGTVYICGYNDEVPLPDSANLIKPNTKSLEGLQNMGQYISSSLGDCELEAAQACYLPLPPKDDPVIGKIPYYNGNLYIATGHYCWGILKGPATGKGLAELIVNGHSTIDLSPFDPANVL